MDMGVRYNHSGVFSGSGIKFNRRCLILNSFSYTKYLYPWRYTSAQKGAVPFSAKLDSSSYASLNLIGEVFANLDRGKLQIIVYQKNNKELARNKAHSIKHYLIDEFSSIEPEKIGISWFSEPHQLEIKNKSLTVDESVNFFVTQK